MSQEFDKWFDAHYDGAAEPDLRTLCQAAWQAGVQYQAITPSEAVYGFTAWLTTRQRTTMMGAGHDCAPAADVTALWCAANKFDPPREDVYPNNLTMPK